MAYRLDLLAKDDKQLFIGDSVAIETTLYDEDGQPLTIPGSWTFEYVVRRGRSALSPSLIETTDITVIATDKGADTGVRIPLTEDDTKELEQNTYYHTLRRNDPGSLTTLFYGDVDFQWTAARTP